MRSRRGSTSGASRSIRASDSRSGASTRLRVLASLERLAAWGYPVVVGVSRKRFVGELSGVERRRRECTEAWARRSPRSSAARASFAYTTSRATRQALERGRCRAPRGRGDGDTMNALAPLRVLHPGWRDVVEVLVVAYALYRVLLLFHGTRTLQIVERHRACCWRSTPRAWIMKLEMITYLLGFVFQYGAIALLVVFAPELRAALAHLGQARFAGLFRQMETARGGRGDRRSDRAPEPVGNRRDHRDRARGAARRLHRSPARRWRRKSPPICWRRSSRRTRRCTTGRCSCAATRSSRRDASFRCRRNR